MPTGTIIPTRARLGGWSIPEEGDKMTDGYLVMNYAAVSVAFSQVATRWSLGGR